MRTLPTILVFAAACACLAACGGGGGRPSGTPVPDPDTIRIVEGRIGYLTTGPRMSMRTPEGRLIPETGFLFSTNSAPAPRIPVEILRPDGTLLATGLTTTTGRYEIQVNFGKNPATQVMVQCRARISLPFGMIVRVFPNESALSEYIHRSPLAGNPADARMTVNLDIGLADGAAAFHMLATLWDPLIVARQGISVAMPNLHIFWEPGNGEDSVLTPEPALAKLLVAGGIAGDDTSNQDAWDSPKLVRLLAEYLMAYFFIERAPEGTPSDALLVPSLAWREGFLDFFACFGRNSNIYWDSEGSGAQGRIVRYFDIESFFDPALGSLGPDDPNVYQDPALVGIGSAFSVAEILWDIHDTNAEDADNDGIQFTDDFLTLQFLAKPRPGIHYPYLFTLLDEYTRAPATIRPEFVDQLLRQPEDQGMRYPATIDNDLKWPPQISPDGQPGLAIAPPFQKTVSDTLDTLTPDPVNFEVGLLSQRYQLIDLVAAADVTVSLSPAAGLVIDILDLDNTVLASGPSPQTAAGLQPRRYLIRVRSTADPQTVAYDLTLTLSAP